MALVAPVAMLKIRRLESCGIVAFLWHFVATDKAVRRELWHCGILFIKCGIYINKIMSDNQILIKNATNATTDIGI